MLKETYLANLKNLPTDAIKVRVAKPSILAPSNQLLKDWKENQITWEQYETRYLIELLTNPKAIARLAYIKELAKTNDVYLFCYEKSPPCHRFILLKVLNGITDNFIDSINDSFVDIPI